MLVRIFLVLLVGLGLLGLVGAFLLSQQQDPVQQAKVNAPPPQKHVLAAFQPVHAGSLIVPADLGDVLMDNDKIAKEAIVDEPPGQLPVRQKLIGAMMRRSLQKDEAFLPGDYLSPGDRGFLAAVLEPGMRAVTVGVDAISGTAGLIWPGDRVDLLLTQQLEDASLPSDRRVAGETLMEDVRVIAVDQQLVQGAQVGANGGSPSVSNRTVTLEVSPVDAERVEVAARLGRISLTVHPASSSAPAGGEPTARMEPPQPVFSGDVSAAIRLHGPSRTGSPVRVYRGAGDAVEYKF